MSKESVALAKKMLKVLDNTELATVVIDAARKVSKKGYMDNDVVALRKAVEAFDAGR